MGVAVTGMYAEDLDDEEEWSSDEELEELLEEKEVELQEFIEEYRLAEEHRRKWSRQVRDAEREVKKAEGRLRLWQGWEQTHEAGDTWLALQAKLGRRRRKRELAGCKRVLTVRGEREDDAMQQEANILFELEAVEQDAEDLRELVADLVRETTAAAAKTSPSRPVDPSGPALEEERSVAAAGVGEAGTGGGAGALQVQGVMTVPGEQAVGSPVEVVEAAEDVVTLAAVDTAESVGQTMSAGAGVLSPAGKKKTRKSKAQERRTARRAAMRANKEVEAEGGVAGAKSQSKIFDPGGA
eukprot:SAG31_NODE_9577_length_1256_cov_1.949870_1_plen_297_part_00